MRTPPPVAAKAPAPIAAAVPRGADDAGAPPEAAPSTTREDVTLVAVGKTWGAKLLWLSLHGSRVWLSGRNVDALADGDGPLVKQTDPLEGLSYQAGKHVLLVAGVHPHLYALRYERREVPSQPSNPVVFVRTSRGWAQAKPLANTLLPVAFVPWGEGALVVHSQVGPSIPAGLPSYAPGRPGTELQYVAPSGAVSDPKLGVERSFMAWSADSDGKTLSLFGTVRTDHGEEDPEYAIELARGTSGALRTSVLFRTTQFAWADMSLARVREDGATALVLPPDNNTELGSWKPNARTIYEIRAAGPRPTVVRGNADRCRISDALLDRGSLLAIETCFDSGATRLLRVTAEAVQRVVLPSLAANDGGFRVATPSDEAPIPCEASGLLLRAPDDLWIRAACTSSDTSQAPLPAVFRRGGAPQPVIALP
jgi:hypothetical protein